MSISYLSDRGPLAIREDQDRRIEALMETEGLSRAQIVRDALDAYFSARGIDEEEAPPMTFEDLSELYRAEMSASSLAEARGDLYRAMADLRRRLFGEFRRQCAIDPESAMAEGAEHRKKSAERLSKNIIRMRSDKIIRMACLEAAGSSGNAGALADGEKELYGKARALAMEHMEACLRGQGAEQDGAPEEAPQAPAEGEGRTIQQTLPEAAEEGAPKMPSDSEGPVIYRQGLKRELRSRMAAGEWTSLSKAVWLMRDSEKQWGAAQIAAALNGMVYSGEAERTPPLVKGSRARGPKCRWRLKEGSQ